MTPRERPATPPSLINALEQARSWGFLGDGALDVHIAHAHGFGDAAESLQSGPSAQASESSGGSPSPGRWLDLGSGGGIPGLILAHRWSDREAVLLDSNERRARFLEQVVEDQGWAGRVTVVTDRAEAAGRVEGLRGSFSLVVARSFGPPAITAECGAPFLRLGGFLIVSEPPLAERGEGVDDVRWPAEPVALVGLTSVEVWRETFGYQVLRQVKACPDRFPRRVGVPGKRPLYRVGAD
jgi:16S rRNA (guanine527-N7)-methyltransferase